MNKKFIAILVALLLITAGCTTQSKDEGAAEDSEDLESDTGKELANNVGGAYWYEIKVTESNQQNLVRAQPPFKMEHSLERQNLIERYKYLNDRNNVHHVYLMSEQGQVVSYYVAQGKVSSVNSKLTNNQQIVRAENCNYDTGNGAGGSEGACFKKVESPQMDGSYGENGEAIFFFTTDGHYVEWSGTYLVSEEPKNINDEVVLTEEVDSEGDNNGNNTA